MKTQTPLIYLCIHKNLKKRYKGEEFELKDLFSILGRGLYSIDKKFYYPILKELENLKLIKRVNQHTIKTLKSDVDLENTSRIYKKIGLF